MSRLSLCAALIALTPVAATAQLRLTVSTDKQQYVPGEPVIAYVVIANDGKSAIAIPTALAPEYGALKFLVRAGDGEWHEFRPWTLVENAGQETLAPGGSKSVQGRIFFGAEGWTFNKPGQYAIRVRLLGVTSDEEAAARLRVAVPETAIERQQSDRIVASREAGFFLLFEGGDHLEPGIAVWREVAQSKTALAGYANYALGMMNFKAFTDYSKGTQRAPNWSQAESFFKQSQILIPKDALFFDLNNRTFLRDVLIHNGKANEAKALDAQLSKFIKDDVLMRDLSAGVRGYVQSVKQ